MTILLIEQLFLHLTSATSPGKEALHSSSSHMEGGTDEDDEDATLLSVYGRSTS